MGTWDDGLLDNDTACDALVDLCHEIVGDIVRFGETPAATLELCAAVGVLLQLSEYDFDLESDRGPQIVTAVAHHADAIAALPEEARRVMQTVLEGKGKELAVRKDAGDGNAELVNSGATTSRFGERHAELFATGPGAAYVQTIADRCVEAIEDDMDRPEDWSDMNREMGSMGLLAVLLVISPCEVPVATIETWRTNARKGIAELRERHDDELEFHEGYYANLERAFGLLLTRYMLSS